jgi:DNA mismatch repair ATPase MutL
MNSLDAAATSVSVRVGADARIRVEDNGKGMPRATLAAVGVWGATSKALQDSLLGFRGEALASLASLARVHVVTKDSATGETWQRDLADTPITEASHPRESGTEVIVSELFHRLPVRRGEIDGGGLTCFLEHIAVAHPWCAFDLDAHGHKVFSVPRALNRKLRMQQIVGCRSFRRVALESRDRTVKISGYVGMGGTSKDYQFVSVNGRPCVRQSELLQVIANATKAYLRGEGPALSFHGARRNDAAVDPKAPHALLVLGIQCPADTVDVGCEPGKTMVRFARWNVVQEGLKSAIDCYFHDSSEPVVIWDQLGESPCFSKEQEEAATPRGLSALLTPEQLVRHSTKPSTLPPRARHSLPGLAPVRAGFSISKAALRGARTLGQFDNKFVVVLLPDSKTLCCIDQHAADERVRLEALVAALKEDPSVVVPHTWLPPRMLNVSPRQRSLLQQKRRELERWQWRYELIGGTHVRVRCSPQVFSRPCEPRDLLETLREAPGSSVPRCIRAILNSRACRGAIMFGDALDRDGCESLVRALGSCQWPFSCAHGRPTCVPLGLVKSGS